MTDKGVSLATTLVLSSLSTPLHPPLPNEYNNNTTTPTPAVSPPSPDPPPPSPPPPPLFSQVEDQLPDFPIMNTMTRPLRKASAEHRNIEFQSLCAGQAFPLTTELPAADLIARVVDEAEKVMQRMQG